VEFSALIVNSVLVDRQVWVATNQGLYQIRNGHAEPYSGIQGLRVNVLSRDSQHIWVGTSQGAFEMRPDGEVVRHWTNSDGLPSMEIGQVFRDSRNDMWFATEGSGVARWDGSKMAIVSTEQGLSNDIVYHIAEPFDGQLWIAHAKGIDRLQLQDMNIDRLTYHEGYSIKGAITYRLDCAVDSVLWVSTSLGAVQLRLTQVQSSRLDLPMRLKHFVVNQRDMTQQLMESENPVFPYDQNQIEVEIGAISFLYGSDLLYQFKLDGAESNWSAPVSSSVMRYFSLPPGSYTLRARVVTPNQTIEGLQIRFTIDQPFWQKAWFILLAVVGAASIVFGLYRWRTLALRGRAEELTFEVQSRTRDLASQKTELEKTLQVLKETQAQLIQAEKMSSLGQLVAGIAHEINNPLSVVYGNLPLLENDLRRLIERNSTAESAIDEENAEATLKSIREASRRIMDIVETLRRFSRLDEAVHKDTPLAECVDNAIQMLRFQFPALQVEFSKDADLTIRCYPQEFQQAVYHIMLNGIQAQNGNPPRLKIRLGQDDSSATVRIRDFGKGIPQSIHARIFDPFFTTKDIGEGRGLGLSLAYGIVQKHRGSISFTTSAEGTEFEVRVPLT